MYWLDDQSVSYILFVLAVPGLFLYCLSSFFIFTSLIYARLYLHKKTDSVVLTENLPGVSVVKPLMGLDPLLEINLESHFSLSYPKFELLFCVQDEEDPAINLVHKLSERYPKVEMRLFIGGENGIINPMVHNMAPAYNNAKYEYVWISTSRIKASDDIMWDFVYKLQKPNVALVHQLPFTTDLSGFAATVEKLCFGCGMARYYLAFNFLGLCCCTGMSYTFKKAALDELNGLGWYGKYLAEDFFLTKALHEKGHKLVVSSIPAQQNLASTTIIAHKDRMVRWLRLRLNMLTAVAILEPLGEAVPLGLYASWCIWHFFEINPYIFFFVHLAVWILRDYFQLTCIQPGSLPFSKLEFLVAWLFREVLQIVIYLEAMLSPRTIKWGKRTYRLSLGGHTQVMETKSTINL